MPPIVENGVEAVTTVLQRNGDVCQNVLHYSGNGPITADGRAALAGNIAAAYNNDLAAVTDEGATLVHVRVSNMGEDPWVPTDVDVSFPGTNVSGPLPAQVAAVISLRTGAAGRRGRGRIYIGALGQSSIGSDGSIAESTRSALLTYVTDVFGPMTVDSTTVHLGVWSRLDNVIRPVTDVVVDQRFDVQRRRANRRLF